MTMPDWDTPAPPEAVRPVIDALALAAEGDAQGCCTAIANSTTHPGWLKIVSVDTLAALCRPDPAIYSDLVEQLHERAVAAGAPDAQLRASLHVVALAQSRDRRADLRTIELESGCEFSDHDVACVACQLAGQVAATIYGDALAERLQAATKLYGGAP